MGAGAPEIGSAVATRRHDRLLGCEAVNRTVLKKKRDQASAAAFIVKDEVECEIFHEEPCTAAHRLPIERVQHGVTSAVCRCTASPDGWSFAVIGIVTAKRTLIDLGVIGTGERHAVVLQLVDRFGCVPTQVLDCILVSEPVGAFDGVVHMPTPVVGSLVSKRRRDAALGRHGMRAGGKHLGYAGGAQSRLDRT